MSPFWMEGTPIQVEQNGEQVLAFVWQGQRHEVMAMTRRWRVDEGWWGVRVWRDYAKLTTHSGLLVIVFQDLLTGVWYLQRLYD